MSGTSDSIAVTRRGLDPEIADDGSVVLTPVRRKPKPPASNLPLSRKITSPTAHSQLSRNVSDLKNGTTLPTF